MSPQNFLLYLQLLRPASIPVCALASQEAGPGVPRAAFPLQADTSGQS